MPRGKPFDKYSAAKKEQIKRRYQKLTYGVYCLLSGAYELTDVEVKEMYGVNAADFQYFRDNHYHVLKEKRGWI